MLFDKWYEIWKKSIPLSKDISPMIAQLDSLQRLKEVCSALLDFCTHSVRSRLAGIGVHWVGPLLNNYCMINKIIPSLFVIVIIVIISLPLPSNPKAIFITHELNITTVRFISLSLFIHLAHRWNRFLWLFRQSYQITMYICRCRGIYRKYYWSFQIRAIHVFYPIEYTR